MQHTINAKLLAIVAAAAFTAGSLVILLGPVMASPDDWTAYHALTILTVFGTIAAGHLAAVAARARHLMAAFGFGLLFVAGTALVVYNSVGRQAEVSSQSVFSAEATNQAIASKSGALTKARERFDDANRYADKEMTGERCGPRCKDWKLRATEVGAHISALEAELKALGPQKPVNVKAGNMADILALFGFDKAPSEAALLLLEPFLWTLFFELGCVIAWGYAFKPPAPVIQAITEGVTLTDEDVAELVKILRARRRPLTNNEMANALGVTKGTASKLVSEAVQMGIVSRQRIGKEVAITLH